jgi:hypothetical protein
MTCNGDEDHGRGRNNGWREINEEGTMIEVGTMVEEGTVVEEGEMVEEETMAGEGIILDFFRNSIIQIENTRTGVLQAFCFRRAL